MKKRKIVTVAGFIILGIALNLMSFPLTISNPELIDAKELFKRLEIPADFSEKTVQINAEDFFKKVYGTENFAVTKRSESVYFSKEKEFQSFGLMFFSGNECEVRAVFIWEKNEECAFSDLLNYLMKIWSSWAEIPEYYQRHSQIGTFSLIPKSDISDRAFLVRNNVSVHFYFETPCPREEAVKLLQEIDDLLCGKTEFLPEDAPEFLEIRKAYEEELRRRRKVAEEESAKREREWQERERQKRIAELRTFAVKPIQEREIYKKLETRFDLLKNHLKPQRVPAGAHDPDAWKKLSLKTIRPLFKKYEFNARGSSDPLLYDFGIWRNDDEIKKTKSNGIHHDVEIAHAKTFKDAWDWALYFRLKYSEDTEQRARLTMLQLARVTHQNAFPNLGDINISWRGRMNSSFYPEEKSAESLIIFIRGTTTVCVRSNHTDTSALPLARLLDKQLLEGDASHPDEFYLPENFIPKNSYVQLP